MAIRVMLHPLEKEKKAEAQLEETGCREVYIAK
jgi:hypothetical protein